MLITFDSKTGLTPHLNLFFKHSKCLLMNKIFKGACSDPQLHPPPSTFESYSEDSVCEILCAKSVQFRRKTLRIESVVSTIYKTISNINIVSSNCLQMRCTYLNFFHHFGWKSDHVRQFKENSFSKYFETSTFNLIKNCFNL